MGIAIQSTAASLRKVFFICLLWFFFSSESLRVARPLRPFLAKMRSRSIRMSRAAGNSPPKLQKYRNFTPAVPRRLSFSPFSAVFADETCLLSVYAPPAPCRIAPSRACARAPDGGFLVCVRGKKFASAARWAYSHSGADAYLTRQSSCRVGDRVSNTRLRRRGTGGCIAPIRVFRLP